MSAKSLKQIFVLNVRSFSERRLFMQQQLAAVGLQAEFIFDWDIDDLNEQIVKQYFNDNNNLSAGQKSCALKHITALKKAAANDGFTLILEDDAVFNNDFILGLQRVFEQSDQFPGEKVIYIGSGGNFFTPQSQRKSGQYLYLGRRGRFTDSYILDNATANKRLDWINTSKISVSIDNQFDLMDRFLGIQILWLEEPVVEQGSKNGLFNSALEAAPPLWLKAITFRWEKLKRKYIYQLWR